MLVDEQDGAASVGLGPVTASLCLRRSSSAPSFMVNRVFSAPWQQESVSIHVAHLLNRLAEALRVRDILQGIANHWQSISRSFT
jgi:hypothetical protein